MTTASAPETAAPPSPGTITYTTVDPNENPALAQALANEAMHGEDSGPVLAKRPPKDIIELPGGWVDAKGALHRKARIRELTGRDEELMTRPSVETAVQVIDIVVHNCLVDVDGQKLSENQIDNLLIGDREAIFLAVRVATYGPTVRMPVLCPYCDHGFDIKVDLQSDIAVKELPPPAEQRLRTVKLPTGLAAEVNLMTGAAQKAAYREPKLTDVERNNIILKECLYRVGGEYITELDQVLAMNANDLRMLRKFLEDNSCGPRWWEVKQECPRCQKTEDLPISLVALFQ